MNQNRQTVTCDNCGKEYQGTRNQKAIISTLGIEDDNDPNYCDNCQKDFQEHLDEISGCPWL